MVSGFSVTSTEDNMESKDPSQNALEAAYLAKEAARTAESVAKQAEFIARAAAEKVSNDVQEIKQQITAINVKLDTKYVTKDEMNLITKNYDGQISILYRFMYFMLAIMGAAFIGWIIKQMMS
jgi:hypothetical protein